MVDVECLLGICMLVSGIVLVGICGFGVLCDNLGGICFISNDFGICVGMLDGIGVCVVMCFSFNFYGCEKICFKIDSVFDMGVCIGFDIVCNVLDFDVCVEGKVCYLFSLFGIGGIILVCISVKLVLLKGSKCLFFKGFCEVGNVCIDQIC